MDWRDAGGETAKLHECDQPKNPDCPWQEPCPWGLSRRCPPSRTGGNGENGATVSPFPLRPPVQNVPNSTPIIRSWCPAVFIRPKRFRRAPAHYRSTRPNVELASAGSAATDGCRQPPRGVPRGSPRPAPPFSFFFSSSSFPLSFFRIFLTPPGARAPPLTAWPNSGLDKYTKFLYTIGHYRTSPPARAISPAQQPAVSARGSFPTGDR